MEKKSLTGQLIAFSVPLVLSGLLQQMFSWADAFIVGNIVGEQALGAVGATMYVTGLFVAAITGFTSGVCILSAQMFGEGNLEDQKRVLFTFLSVLTAALLAVSAGGYFFVEDVLGWMDTPADIFAMSAEYLSIILIGVPFLTIYNVYAAVLRGVGDSRTPFLAVMVSVSSNVVLDLLLVGALGMGVAGAAAATVLSQAMMALFLMGYSGRVRPEMRMRGARDLFDRGILKRGCALAAPITVQSVISSVGGLALQSFMNSFGSQTVAAISTAYRVDSVILLPLVNLGTGVSTLAAQNTGAGEHRQARKCLYVGAVMMAAVAVCLTVVVVVFGGSLIAMFGVTPQATAIGVRFFRCIAPFYIVCGWGMALRGYLEGTGDAAFSGGVGIASLCARIALSYALVGRYGSMVIAYAEAYSWCIMLLLYLVRLPGRQKALARKKPL